jgi:uncharacterized protein YajQ (UPF0234 family)
MRKYTLKDIETAKNEMIKEKRLYDSLSLKEKIYSNQSKKLNKAIRNYKLIKSLFFGGNN